MPFIDMKIIIEDEDDYRLAIFFYLLAVLSTILSGCFAAWFSRRR